MSGPTPEQAFYRSILATIDSRERDADILDILIEAGCTIETLDSRDFRSLNFAAEHKGGDFISSMLNGTMERQVEEISDAKISILVVSRSFEDIVAQTYHRKGVDLRHIYGFVARLICAGYVPLFLDSPIHVANLLKTIAVKAYDPKGELTYRVSRLPPVPQPARTYMMLPERRLPLPVAEKLAAKYPTISELVAAVQHTAVYKKNIWPTKKAWKEQKWNAGTGVGVEGARQIEELILSTEKMN